MLKEVISVQAAKGKPLKSILKQSTTTESQDDYEEWSGFSDEDDTEEKQPEPEAESEPEPVSKPESKSALKPESKPASRPESKSSERGEDKAKSTQAEEKRKESKKKSKEDVDPNISFAALEDEEETGVDVSAWDPLGLSPAIQTALSKLGFSTPTTIQRSAIPEILAGHDVIGKASTGSGKTLAFGIPILEHYLTERENTTEECEVEPIALILSPTRELAHQLAKHIGDLNTHTPGANARIALLTGGLSIQKQQRLLADADIVIGTPGRVWEILSSGHGLIAKMKRIKFLVVDEADRLLSDGHFKEVEDILNALDQEVENDFPEAEEEASSDDASSSQRQTLVFSATFHKGLQQKLAGKGKFKYSDTTEKESMEYLLQKLNFREDHPKFIDTNPVSQMAEGLKEGIVECPAMEKVRTHALPRSGSPSLTMHPQDLYLYTLLLYHPKHRTLLFTNSISSVRRLVQFLQNLGLPALALHSNMEQKARLRSVERFSNPSSNPSSILVATDVAARGLDIKGIDFVIHYHVPRTADMYVHRSGRTARAGAPGKSVLLCAPNEVVGVARLIGKVHAESGTRGARRNPLETLELDSRILSRVRPRVHLAKRITEATLAKEKVSSEENWLRNAAEELGVDYDSEEFARESRKLTRGRGGGRAMKEKQASSVSKAELGAMRAELKQLLSQKITVGISERYIAAGRVDVDALLAGRDKDQAFIGLVDKLEF